MLIQEPEIPPCLHSRIMLGIGVKYIVVYNDECFVSIIVRILMV